MVKLLAKTDAEMLYCFLDNSNSDIAGKGGTFMTVSLRPRAIELAGTDWRGAGAWLRERKDEASLEITCAGVVEGLEKSARGA